MLRVRKVVIYSRGGGEWTEAERAVAHDFFIISDLDRVKREASNPDGLGCVVRKDL